MNRSLLRLLAGILAVFCLSLSASAAVVIVQAGQPMAVIMTPPGPSAIITKAAQEFQLHIQMMSGATLTISTAGNEGSYPGKNFVYIGASSGTNGVVSTPMTDELFNIKTVGTTKLCIVGRDNSKAWNQINDSHPGTMFGVYYVLGDVLGCRWLWPGGVGTYAPKSTDVSVPDLNVTNGGPTFVQRYYRIPHVGQCLLSTTGVYGGMSIPIIPASSSVRAQMADEEYLWMRRQQLGTRFDPPFAHSFNTWWDTYGASHPEYFAVLTPDKTQPFPIVNGEKRVKLDDALPAVWTQIVNDRLSSKMNICLNDSKGFSVSAISKAWDYPSQADDVVCNSGSALLGNRMAHFYSAVGDLAKSRLATAVVYGYAYDVYKNYPQIATVSSNVALAYIPGSTSAVVLSGGASDSTNILGWINAGCTQMYLRPNWMLGGHCGPYWPLNRGGENFRVQVATGKLLGLDSDSSCSAFACFGLWYYQMARTMQNSSLTMDQIKTEYCSAFGPAASKMREYFDYWETYIYNYVDVGGSHEDIGGWSSCVPAYDNTYTSAAFDGADAILTQAYALLGPSDTEAKARVDFIKEGNDHGRLTSDALASVNPAIPPSVNPTAIAKFQTLLAYRDAHAADWSIWREYFIQRESDYVTGAQGYWNYVLNGGGGSGGGTGSKLGAFIEDSGLVVMEAENYTEKQAGANSFASFSWQQKSDAELGYPTPPAYSGGYGMLATPNTGVNTDTAQLDAPRLDFRVDFTTTGTYYVFVRFPSNLAGSDNSIDVGQDGSVQGTNMQNGTGKWSWQTQAGGNAQVMIVPTPGVYTFNIWMREDGVAVDKVILTTNAAYPNPGTGMGPTESLKHSSVQYTLTVTNGTGSGTYDPDAVVPISADAPLFGYVFDQWIGDTDNVADVTASDTTITMQDSDAALTATYKVAPVTYPLTVINGSGTGDYEEAAVVPIVADAAPAGFVFAAWTGDTASIAAVANAAAASTTVTMPTTAVVLTATYTPLSYTLTVTSGTGSGTYPTQTVVPIVADAPPGGTAFAGWNGDTATVADIYAASTSITMPPANAALTATYSQTYTLTVTSGTGSGVYTVGRRVTITAAAPAHGKLFDRWTGDTTGVASVTSASTYIMMPAADAALTAAYKDAPQYSLTVTNGSGSGSYFEGDVVNIAFVPPGPNQVFNVWTGNTANIADVNSSSTTYTMGAFSAAVTATYTQYYQLSVTSGAGSGLYTLSQVVPISASAPQSGYIFSRWSGDTVAVAAIASTTSASTTITMPGVDSSIIALYVPVYALTVTSGTGSGSYLFGTVVPIVANNPPAGYAFSKWTGDTAGVANVNNASTSVTMPASAVNLTATYELLYTLTVNSGSGSGSFKRNTVVTITASAPATGYGFTRWVGDTAGVASVIAASTTITMPASNVVLTATYSLLPGWYILTVNSGTGTGVYPTGAMQAIIASAAPVGMVFDKWTGDTATLANISSSFTTITMPNFSATVTATYKVETLVFVTVNFGTGGGQYRSGTVINIGANKPPAGTYFRTWSGDTATVANIYTANTTLVVPTTDIAVSANYGPPLSLGNLTVVNGTGGGIYEAGLVVNIVANAPAAGKAFLKWTGDTAYVADPTSTSTTVTIPAANITLTATYGDLVTLTVVNGSGSGSYLVGAIVNVAADAPPAGLAFHEWVGDTQWIANSKASPTTYTMPNGNAVIYATYVDPALRHTLTVNNGTGSGIYLEGNVVAIHADPAPTGYEFDSWTGNIAYLADPTAASTTVTIGSSDVTVTANYREKIIILTYPDDANISFEYGSKVNITWTASTLPIKQPLRITLLDGNGGSWILTQSAQAGKGIFPWTVGKYMNKLQAPYGTGDTYRIEISTLDGSYYDRSHNTFAIGRAVSLIVAGPTTVNEQSIASYVAVVVLDYGYPILIPSSKVAWSVSNSAAKISGGNLTTGIVASDTTCTINAKYKSRTGTITGSLDIKIKNN